MEGIRLRVGDWASASEACRIVRVELGDGTTAQDAEDEAAVHVLAVAAGDVPVAAGRLMPGGRIDRLGVRKAWRGCGVGSAVLALLVEEARERGDVEVRLDAPVSVLPFFRQFDAAIEAVGEPVVLAGVKHQALRLRLQP